MADQRNRATYQAIAGRRWSPGSEPAASGGFVDWLAVIVGAFGGNVSAAARAMDVPRRSVRDWLAGTTRPGPERRSLVRRTAAALTRRTRLTAGREPRLRNARTIRIEGVDRYDDEERDVTFHVGQQGTTGLAPGTLGRLVDAYLGGGNASDDRRSMPGLFDVIIDGMTDPNGWYQTFFRSKQAKWGCDVYRVTIT